MSVDASGGGHERPGAGNALAFGQENHTLSEYIDWAVVQARRMNEIDMQLEGDTDDMKATSLVQAMLDAGLAEKLRAGATLEPGSPVPTGAVMSRTSDETRD